MLVFKQVFTFLKRAVPLKSKTVNVLHSPKQGVQSADVQSISSLLRGSVNAIDIYLDVYGQRTHFNNNVICSNSEFLLDSVLL